MDTRSDYWQENWRSGSESLWSVPTVCGTFRDVPESFRESVERSDSLRNVSFVAAFAA